MVNCSWCDTELDATSNYCPECKREIVKFAEMHTPANNKLKQKANNNLSLGILFAIPIVIYFILIYTKVINMAELGVFHVLIFLIFAFPASYFFRQFKISSAGLQGEEQATEYLSGLPSGYHVFTNLKISFEQFSNEIDAIIVGENGVFILEVKNHNGRIVGNSEDHQWIQYKVGRKGSPYQKEMRNPIKQVKGQIMTLSKNLKLHGVDSYIQGIVLFTYSDVTLQISNKNDIPIITSEKLNPYILNYNSKTKLHQDKIDKITGWLKNQY